MTGILRGRARLILIAYALGFSPTVSIAQAQDSRTPTGMTVSVLKTARRCFAETVRVSGFLEPSNAVLVRAEREGLVISEIDVQPGDNVTAGQVLARLGNPMTFADDGTVTSPVAGRIMDVGAVIGAYASASASAPLFRIIAGGEVELRAETLPSQAALLKVGQAVALHAPDMDGVTGKLRAIDRAVDSVTQMTIVRVSIPVGTRLQLGAFVRGDIETGKACGVAVPLSAILYSRDGALVETVRNGRIEVRGVEIGVVAGGDVEIRTGLGEDETVVVRAGSFLREGDPVRPAMIGAEARR